jgi:hypothetical protein
MDYLTDATLVQKKISAQKHHDVLKKNNDASIFLFSQDIFVFLRLNYESPDLCLSIKMFSYI